MNFLNTISNKLEFLKKKKNKEPDLSEKKQENENKTNVVNMNPNLMWLKQELFQEEMGIAQKTQTLDRILHNENLNHPIIDESEYKDNLIQALELSLLETGMDKAPRKDIAYWRLQTTKLQQLLEIKSNQCQALEKENERMVSCLIDVIEGAERGVENLSIDHKFEIRDLYFKHECILQLMDEKLKKRKTASLYLMDSDYGSLVDNNNRNAFLSLVLDYLIL